MPCFVIARSGMTSRQAFRLFDLVQRVGKKFVHFLQGKPSSPLKICTATGNSLVTFAPSILMVIGNIVIFYATSTTSIIASNWILQ
jgi:hypothetical protein